LGVGKIVVSRKAKKEARLHGQQGVKKGGAADQEASQKETKTGHVARFFEGNAG